MKTFFLAACLTGLLCQPVQASFDGDGCDFWLAPCTLPLGSYPFLWIDNDTRANLLLLESDKHQFASVYAPLAAEPGRSRELPFSIPRIAPLSGTNEYGFVITEVDIPAIKKLADQLGVDISALDLSDKMLLGGRGRMVSNTPAALAQFFQLLIDDKALTPEQRKDLAHQRVNLLVNPELADVSTAVFPEKSHAADLHNYLLSAAYFYNGNFSEATTGFQNLLKANQPWVAETATYMLFRVALNQSIEHALDEYEMFDVTKSDKNLTSLAAQKAKEYLAAYPTGRYAASTQDLYRRIHWFASDWNELAKSSEQALGRAANLEMLQTLINEVDTKLLSSDAWQSSENQFVSAPDTPMLTLTQTLRRLREGYQSRPNAILVTEAEINGYKPMFEKAGMASAWNYLHSVWLFYLPKDYAKVESSIPAATTQALTDTVDFSLQVLLGQALQAEKKWPQAEAHWRHLLTLKTTAIQQQFLQLMLTNSLAYQGKPELVFAANSPVTSLRFRSLVLKDVADASLLRQQVTSGVNNEERVIALHTLLTRDLITGNYSDYLKDRALGKDSVSLKFDKSTLGDVNITVFDWDGSNTEKGYHCASLDKTAEILAQQPKDGHALNCMGEFFRLTETRVNTEREYGLQWQLNDAPAMFKGKEQSRLTHYQQVIANANAEPEDKSYALYRAIMCYSPSGYNRCDGQEIDNSVRKSWFQQLKRDYKGSVWAEKLRYYW
ncbi:hypothetical protein [Limnobaculum parvum]|uniref:Outer membrane assembly lipoprotein YfiO n=1 Tax=Limnobaculum parvum TaxID=2172103 RepID=A0A2Y9TZN4_9GAMM|nr:hypothetical protein [Limnobaculum parvum]AWH89203.1 hypothetical protein HYN51_11980 [Limnobaculum parvum]